VARIAITQRVQDLPDRAERRDALDQAWTPWVEAGGDVAIPIPNRLDDPVAYVQGLAVDALVLTGGNDLAHLPDAQNPAPERDATERALLAHARDTGLPVLAVCRGMQMLVEFWGGAVTRVEGHVARPHEIVVSSTNSWFRAGPVNSFHDWGVAFGDLPPELRPGATAPDGTVEAVVHRELHQIGVMWHPERAPADAADRALLDVLLGDGR
jgi:N5-(cytidine 5'-diphosphoramidyl)-L-glutamine hydrolase